MTNKEATDKATLLKTSTDDSHSTTEPIRHSPLIVVAGPTAVGKTAAAIALAQRFNGVDPHFMSIVRRVFGAVDVKQFYGTVAAIRARN